MRIVSLVPAGTEIAWALGLERDLVAVTHDCDFPPAARALPRVTASSIPPGAASGEIDRLVRAAGEHGASTFHVDADALRAARPDLLLGQAICRVCAVTLEQLLAEPPLAVRDVPLDAASLERVFADIRRVAAALGVPSRGEDLVRELRARLDRVAARVAGQPRPRVVCLEWLDPLFAGGHWVPEQVALAGGVDVLGTPGERSREVDWSEVIAARPDVLVLMPCGFDAARARTEAVAVTGRPHFAELPAARSGRVFVADGAAYFSRPGPRLVDGVEVLAGLLHPDVCARPAAEAAAPLAEPGDPVREAVQATIRRHPELARDTSAAVPKAWGRLAGHAVLAYREIAGRPAAEAERRSLWRALWYAAHERRAR